MVYDGLYYCYCYEIYLNVYLLLMIMVHYILMMFLILIYQSLLHFLNLLYHLFCMNDHQLSLFVDLMCLLYEFCYFLIYLSIALTVIIHVCCLTSLTPSFEKKYMKNYLTLVHLSVLQFWVSFIMIFFYLTVSYHCL